MRNNWIGSQEIGPFCILVRFCINCLTNFCLNKWLPKKTYSAGNLSAFIWFGFTSTSNIPSFPKMHIYPPVDLALSLAKCSLPFPKLTLLLPFSPYYWKLNLHPNPSEGIPHHWATIQWGELMRWRVRGISFHFGILKECLTKLPALLLLIAQAATELAPCLNPLNSWD